MATNNIQLKDGDGNLLYPKTNADIVEVGSTSLSAVLTQNNKNLFFLDKTTFVVGRWVGDGTSLRPDSTTGYLRTPSAIQCNVPSGGAIRFLDSQGKEKRLADYQITIKARDIDENQVTLTYQDSGQRYITSGVVKELYIFGATDKMNAVDGLYIDGLNYGDTQEQIYKAGVDGRLSSLENESYASTLKVLFIGSSFGVDTIFRLPQICHNMGLKIICGNLYFGSASLKSYLQRIANNTGMDYYKWNINDVYGDYASGSAEYTGNWLNKTSNCLVKTALADELWDYIIIQNGAYQSPKEDEFITFDGQGNVVDNFVQQLIDYCKNHVRSNPVFGMNETWAFSIYHTVSQEHINDDIWDSLGSTGEEKQTAMYNLIVANYKTAMDYTPDVKFVVPTGDAVQQARISTNLDDLTTYPNIGSLDAWSYKNDMTRDSIHADFVITRFLGAGSMFETFVGKAYGLKIADCTLQIPLGNAGNDREQLATALDSTTLPLCKQAIAEAVALGNFAVTRTDSLFTRVNSLENSVEELGEVLTKVADRDTNIYVAKDCLGIRDSKWDSRYTAYYVIVRKGDVVKVTPQEGVVNGSIAFVTISSLENTSAGASVTFANGTTSAPINVHRNDGEKTFDIIEDCALVVYTKYTAQCTPTLVKINGMTFQSYDGTTITFEDITWNDYDEVWRNKVTQNINSINAINDIIGGSSANEVDVVMFSGQSNAAGRGVVNSSYPQEAPTCPTSHGYEFRAIRSSGDTDYLVPIVKTFGVDQNKVGGISDTNGTGTPSKTGGLVPSFVNAYFDISKTPIIGVSASKGGTGIATFASTSFLNDMKQRMTDCLTYLSDNNYVVKNKYFVWWQGENDAYNTQTQTGMTKEEYKTYFLTMWAALKTVGFETAMIIDVHRPKPGSTEASTYDTDDIATAQFELAKENYDIIIISTKPSAIPDTMKDGWHFTQYGYNLVGQSAGYHAGIWQRYGITQPMYNIVDDDLFFDNKVN